MTSRQGDFFSWQVDERQADKEICMVGELERGSLSFRKATHEDIPTLKDLFRETVTTVNRGDYTCEETADWASCMDSRARWEELIDGMHVVVAVAPSDSIVGFAAINDEGYLHSMFVHKDCQGQGVATFLLGIMEEYAKRNGINEITSEVSITAKPFLRAERIYCHNGTKGEGEQTVYDKL